MNGTAEVIHGDAHNLPLTNDSVDLVITSPPYYALRSYTDNGQHYDKQIGSEATPDEYVTSLLDVTRECMRVLKPSGSLWVNLGDSFSGGIRYDSGFMAEDAAWLAGVIDSDGSISIRVDNAGRSHVAWTRVGQMRPEVAERILQVTRVGKVWQDKRGVWNWSAAAQQAHWVLQRIWPWLLIKQRQALAAIDLMDLKQRGKRKGQWNPLTDDDLDRRERIRQAVLAWNRGEESGGYEPPAVGFPQLNRNPQWVPQKSLIGIPWRYALRCIDELGLILRAEVIWSKPNGIPESVTDRVRRAHEQWFHFTLSPRYFSAVDEIRETYNAPPKVRGIYDVGATPATDARFNEHNPLGKLPGSVWTVPTEPLRVPDHLGVDHFAAFPTEWPRRIIQGWSPSGVCVECGEGRRPVTVLEHTKSRGGRQWNVLEGGPEGSSSMLGHESVKRITGYTCACPEPTADTTPATVLDPFGGTGTTALVAKTLGRHGISVDASRDYCRLAEWRVSDPNEMAKAARVDKPPQQVDGQIALWEEAG